MRDLSELLAYACFVVPWLAGIALAQGAWQTFFAFFPPYAWYLVVEKALQLAGWFA